ncbi:ACT domain-containing protein [uncultured Shimia sp.]|uniref:ACT domain-containing protein n=1 Tax=uncultured Shimia sp. TaxID=573152 RepID=UPI002632832B|nr:ACT domain-containing protein [uncultured Shimia sp.]
MADIAHSAHDMIAGMTPDLRPGQFVFASIKDPEQATRLLVDALGTYNEAEGLSLLLPLDVAQAEGLSCDHPMRCITLNVYSALDGVGLTAAVATALAENGIACNMVAAHHHDHAFVPAESAERALALLKGLQSAAQTQA